MTAKEPSFVWWCSSGFSGGGWEGGSFEGGARRELAKVGFRFEVRRLGALGAEVVHRVAALALVHRGVGVRHRARRVRKEAVLTTVIPVSNRAHRDEDDGLTPRLEIGVNSK